MIARCVGALVHCPALADETLTILIDEAGRVTVEGRGALRRLAARPGRYRLVPSTPNLVILERLEAAPGTGERHLGHIVLSGDIERLGSLIDVIQFVHANQWSGQLAVVGGTARKSIHFKLGDVITASSNVAEDRIGAILYRFGLITQEDLEKSLTQVTQEHRFGQILVDNGLISAHDLYQFVRKQIEEIFHSVLAFRQGEYYFYKTTAESGPPSQLQLSTKQLLFEGVRRIDEMSYFRAKLPTNDMVLQQRVPQPTEKLPHREARVLSLVDGTRDIIAISRDSHLGEFETMKVLYQLFASHYVQMPEVRKTTAQMQAAPGTDPATMVVDIFNQAYARVHTTVKTNDKELALARGLESFFSSMTEFAPLFSGVSVTDEGELPRESILANLSMAPVDDKLRLDYLYRGLNELLFFELFIAGEGAVDRRAELELHEKLHQILRDVPARVKEGE